MNKKKLATSYLNISIPQDVENMQLPNPELLTFYRNYEDRILWIDDEINDYSIEYAKYIMLALKKKIENQLNCCSFRQAVT